MITRYSLYDKQYEAGHADLYALLPQAHEARIRPVCLCMTPGVEMYIARFNERYLIKRMPGTSRQHAIECDSYDPPPELSGFGEVEGSAIREDVESGEVTLRFAFALSKGASREPPEPTGKETDSVKADGKKLTLRGTLHYLWEEAGLNRWTPAMAGKRSWYVVRKYLLQAAAGKVAKGAVLGDLLYIPESFVADQKSEIQQRRMAQIARSVQSKRYLLVIGELKEIAPARFGHKLVLKHLPDYGLMLDDDIHDRLLKRFGMELEFWDAADGGVHLLAIATAKITPSGVAQVQEASFMLTTNQWIPFDNGFEKTLLDTLADRRYRKCLRYNLPSSRPLASAVLTDVEQATALYIVPPEANDAWRTEFDALLEGSDLDAWVWEPGKDTMSGLPVAASNYRRLSPAHGGTNGRAIGHAQEMTDSDWINIHGEHEA